MKLGKKGGRWWMVALGLALTYLAVDSSRRLMVLRELAVLPLTQFPLPPLDPGSPTGYALGQRRLFLPQIGTDGYHWIMQAQQMLTEKEGRVRQVDYDNAPRGRENHWSSWLPWWLLAVGWCDRQLTGYPWAASVERVAPYAQTLILALVLVVLTPLVANRFGAVAAALLALGMVLVHPFYEFYLVGATDHHGLAATCGLMTVLFLVAGGGGYVRHDWSFPDRASPEEKYLFDWLTDLKQARRWFLASAVAAGAGMWISAGTEVPVLLGLGVGVVLGAGWDPEVKGGDQQPWRMEPSLWRLWGIGGALTSLFLYAVEYFPSHVELRLETNNPLYALAWLGGAEVMYRVCRWRQGEKPAGSFMGKALLMGALLALAIPPVLIIWAPERTFLVGDPFLGQLHDDYILELQGILRHTREMSVERIFREVNLLSLLGLAMVPLGFFPLAKPWKGILLAALVPGLVFTVLAFLRVRWLGVHCAMMLAALVTVAHVLKPSVAQFSWTGKRKTLAVVLLATVLLPSLADFYLGWQLGDKVPVGRVDVYHAAVRDVAYSLRRRLGQERGVVLTSPNTTTLLTYFGGMQGIGTFYWENLEGLKTAAAIHAAPSAEEALNLVRKHGITHLVIVSWDDFYIPYIRLARGLKAKEPPPENTLIMQMLTKENFPAWLRPVHYRLPIEERLRNKFVRIFEVVPNQSEEEALVRFAEFFLLDGNVAQAETKLQKALERNPDFLPALIKQAQVKHHLKQTAAFKDTLRRISGNIEHVAKLSLEDRVGLALVFFQDNDPQQMRRQIEGCQPFVNETNLRRLDSNTLFNLILFARKSNLVHPVPDVMRLGAELLPTELQAQLSR